MSSWMTGWRRQDQAAGLLASVCLVLWAVQWVADGRFTVPRLPERPVPTVEAAPRATPALPLNVDDAVIAARPLFIETRRPYVPPAPAATSESPAAPPEPLTLLATVMAEGRLIALIQSQRDSRIEKLGIGEAIAGWTLADVQSGHVILKQGTESRQLDLLVVPGDAGRAASRATEREE